MVQLQILGCANLVRLPQVLILGMSYGLKTEMDVILSKNLQQLTECPREDAGGRFAGQSFSIAVVLQLGLVCYNNSKGSYVLFPPLFCLRCFPRWSNFSGEANGVHLGATFSPLRSPMMQ